MEIGGWNPPRIDALTKFTAQGLAYLRCRFLDAIVKLDADKYTHGQLGTPGTPGTPGTLGTLGTLGTPGTPGTPGTQSQLQQ